MNIGARKWGTLIILSIIWGSSYILIKKGLTGLTPVQLGSLRMIITAILIVPFSINKLKNIPKDKIKWVVVSAFIGTFFPNYLFAFAATTNAVKDHHFDAVFEAYVVDKKILDFMAEVNPAALDVMAA